MIRKTFEIPFTYLITPGRLTAAAYRDDSEALVDKIAGLARIGLGAVQLREKNLPTNLQYDLAMRVRRALAETTTLCLVNERFDIAAASGADGVHLTSRSIPVESVRRTVGSEFFVAVSTHSTDEIARARAGGADFAVFGPVYRTPGKGGPVGLEGLWTAVAAAGRMPVVALGGIDEKNYSEALTAGAGGVAAIRLFEDEAAAGPVIRQVNRLHKNQGVR